MTERRMIRFGLAGLNQTPLDWRGNAARIRKVWREARAAGVQLLCLPELTIPSYGCEDRFLHPDTAARSLRILSDLARECGGEVVLVGLPLYMYGKLYNGLAVLNRGKIRGITLKSHLALEGIHYEPRWFRGWPMGAKDTLDWEGDSIPVGHLTYRAGGLNFAIEICEDAWVEEKQRPCRHYGSAQFVFNASASHFSMGKADIREGIVRESSARFGIGYGYNNLVGCESGRAIYDGEALVAEEGEIVNRGDRLYLDDTHLLIHDFSFRPERPEVDVLLDLDSPTEDPPHAPRRSERQASAKEEEFARAASLALFDYMRKSRSRGFTLSLSGGVDSSTVAVLVWVMASRLIRELSVDERRTKLGYFKGLNQRATSAEQWMPQLLTTVYQATRNSGDETRRAARVLARAIGANHMHFNVDDQVQAYQKMVGDALGRRLRWDTDDIALQNIQARVRGPGVWMLANLTGSLLLSTSNRSEAAVGYATMDGDTCGGLAPIAGVEKSFLRHWLLYVERQGVAGLPPLVALHHVNRQQPTAELRPPDKDQRDEEDLMPYDILDALEEALINQRQTPWEAFLAVYYAFESTYGAKRLHEWTRKFCKLFAISQWKRERLAPAFHLDDSSLDPKTWARYPILSGAFEAELEELETRFQKEILGN